MRDKLEDAFDFTMQALTWFLLIAVALWVLSRPFVVLSWIAACQ